MKLDLFDYALPPAAIAQSPADPRDSSRLLVLHRATGEIEHRRFSDVLDYLSPGDVLVVNDTRVRAARLRAKKETGGQLEVLVLEVMGPLRCRALVSPGRRVPAASTLVFEDGRRARVLEKTPDGGRLLDFDPGPPLEDWIDSVGQAPLPPYIHTDLSDPDRYQTVYNSSVGSAAAPTAGLHFTPALLEKARTRDVVVAAVTLHVGVDTFRPIKTGTIEAHEMHSEWYDVPLETVEAVRRAHGRVIAVGTTAVRTLESAAVGARDLRAGSGSTRLYITPGYKFKCVDALLTNFHVPKSSLLVLVSAFSGRERVLDAYRTAIDAGYRFLSFGDAMLIL